MAHDANRWIEQLRSADGYATGPYVLGELRRPGDRRVRYLVVADRFRTFRDVDGEAIAVQAHP